MNMKSIIVNLHLAGMEAPVMMETMNFLVSALVDLKEQFAK